MKLTEKKVVGNDYLIYNHHSLRYSRSYVKTYSLIKSLENKDHTIKYYLLYFLFTRALRLNIYIRLDFKYSN